MILEKRKIDLTEYGWNPEEYMDSKEEKLEAKNNRIGRVSEVHRERYQVVCEEGEVWARLKGTFYKELDQTSDVPVVGDFVKIRYNPYGDSLIASIYPRKSAFSRADNSGHAAGYMKTLKEQIVAANFDYVFIVTSLNQNFNLNRIERYLAIAIQSGATPVVILTKVDLVPEYETYVEQISKIQPGIRVHAISAKTGFGLDEVKAYFESGKTIVFLGSSGVGKSTLVNTIAGEEVMKVSEIREEDGRGRHTTTHRQLLLLPSSACVIDTPGMREIGIYEASEGLEELFKDVQELIQQCRFSNCSHRSEPGCAILKALEEETLTQKRWENYLKLYGEAAWARNKSNAIRLKRIEKQKKGKK